MAHDTTLWRPQDGLSICRLNISRYGFLPCIQPLYNRIYLLFPCYSLSTFVSFELAPSVFHCSAFILVLLFFFCKSDIFDYCWYAEMLCFYLLIQFKDLLSWLIKVCMIWALYLFVPAIAFLSMKVCSSCLSSKFRFQ